MSKRLSAFLAGFALLALAGARPAFPYPNEPDGFRGLAWGQDVSNVPGLGYTCWQSPWEESVRKFRDWVDYKVYERRDDELRLGSVPLTTIRYIAWRDRLREVVLVASVKETGDLQRILKARFGPGKAGKMEGRPVVSWQGEKTTIDLLEAERSVELRFISTALAREERKARRDHAMRHVKEKEDLDRKAIEQGAGF